MDPIRLPEPIEGVNRNPSGPRKSNTYGKATPVVYGTAIVKGVPLFVRDVAAHNFDVTRGKYPNWTTKAETRKSADVQYAFAIGPISGIQGIIYDKQYYVNGPGDATTRGVKYLTGKVLDTWPTPPEITVGNPATATVWPPYASGWDEQKVPHGHLAIMRAQNFGYPDGGGNIPEVKAVVRGFHADTVNNAHSGWLDANPADVIQDLLEGARYTLGLPAGTVVTDLGPDGTAASSYRRYCQENGWLIALAVDSDQDIGEVVAQVLAATNSIGIWSEGKFKIVPLGDTAIGTYSPPATALGLTDDDFILADKDTDPIRVTRTSWADTYNVWPVEYSQVTLEWDTELVSTESMVAAPVANYGTRRASVTSLPCIVSGTHAQTISGILARRSLGNRAVFEFTLSPKYGAYLEAGDLVSLSHTVMGLSGQLARVREIEEDGEGNYTVRAGEWTTGATISVVYVPQAPAGLGDGVLLPADAYSEALSANQSINEMASDSMLSPVEKAQAWKDYNALSAQGTSARAAGVAGAVGSTVGAWDTAWGDLTSYLTGLSPTWNDAAAGSTPITGSDWRSHWSAAYAALTNLQAATAAKVNTNRLGVGAALNSDPNCVDPSAWETANIISTTTSGKVGSGIITGTGGTHAFSQRFPVAEGKTYRFHAWVRNVGATGTIDVRLYWYNADGVLNAIRGFDGAANGGVTANATWVELIGTASPPAGATWAKIAVPFNWYTTVGYYEAQDVRCEEAIPGSLLVNGAITVSHLKDARIAFDNGSFMKVVGVGFGANSDLIEWYGPSMAVSACTKANAIAYQDTTGNCYYVPPPQVTCSPTQAIGSVGVTGTVVVNTPYVTVLAQGGKIPYSYSWARVSGDSTITISSATSNYVRWTASVGQAVDKYAVWRCTVTDGASKTFTVDINVQCSNTGP